MLTVEEIKDTSRFPSMRFEAKSTPKSQEQRKDSMCRVKITSLVDGQAIPGGHVIPVGVHEAVVHERDLPVIEAMVEKELNLVEVARQAFNRKVEQSAAEELLRCVDRSPESPEVIAVLKKAHESFPGSVAGTFHQFNDRDIKPFAAVELLEAGLVAPAAQAVTDIQTMTAKLVADQVAHTSTDTAAIVSGVIAELVKAGAIRLSGNGGNDNQKR